MGKCRNIDNLLKIVAVAVVYVITTSSFALFGMERFVDQNWLLNQYPHGWTSMRDVEHFREDMERLYFGYQGYLGELDEEEYEKAIEENIEHAKEMINIGVKPTIDILYERTMSHFPKAGNKDLILSILAFNTHLLSGRSYEKCMDDCFHEAASLLSALRDAFVLKHKPETMGADEFIGKSLWNTQAESIRGLMAAPSVDIRDIEKVYVSNNYSRVAIALCLNILRPKYQDFIDATIAPLLRQYCSSRGINHLLGYWGLE